MRKLDTLIAGACALAIAAAACPLANAQTTFGVTNDPSTTICVETLDTDETVVVLSRAYDSYTEAPFSARTVLRDPATGVAYEMRAFRKSTSKDGQLAVVTAVFRGFDTSVRRFDLIDPVAKQQALYVSQIESPGNTTDGSTTAGTL